MEIDADTFTVGATFHGVKCLIRAGNEIITIRRDARTLHYPHQIDLPGGARERNESPFETAQREIKEELGIKLSPEDIVYGVRYRNSIEKIHDTFFIVTRELQLTEQDITFGEIGIMYNFMTVHDFLNNTAVVEKQKNRVFEYLKRIQGEISEEML